MTRPEALNLLTRAFWHLRNCDRPESMPARVLLVDLMLLLNNEMNSEAA